MKLTEQEYHRYDLFVVESFKILNDITSDKLNIIIDNYKDLMEDKYLLEVCFSFATIVRKPIYIQTDIITYIKLKKRLKRKIHYKFRKGQGIKSINFVLQTCRNRGETFSIVYDIYDAYYAIGDKSIK